MCVGADESIYSVRSTFHICVCERERERERELRESSNLPIKSRIVPQFGREVMPKVFLEEM